VKDKLWRFAQNYGAYLDISADAEILTGAIMKVSSEPRVEHELYLFGEWEPLFSRYLLSIPKNNGIFIDVGANIGYFSILASIIFSEVHAIEASPATSGRLRQNLLANDCSNVVVHEVAVGKEEGFVDFFQDPRQSGAASIFKPEQGVFEARVPIAPIEKILSSIEWSRVKFIKIDVEGFEGPVLDSILKLSKDLPQDVKIFVEYDPKRQNTWLSIQALLDEGYRAALMQGPYDRSHYLDKNANAPLSIIDSEPYYFCDILITRCT
jgi:FkbM family methyltransferase